jgi:hypothetical protein
MGPRVYGLILTPKTGLLEVKYLRRKLANFCDEFLRVEIGESSFENSGNFLPFKQSFAGH